MSERNTNTDVEGILSSIRRLVSDTSDHADQLVETDNAGVPEEDEAQSREALVLTSALRIQDPATELEAHDVDNSPVDLHEFASGRVNETTEEASGGRRLHLNLPEAEVGRLETTPEGEWDELPSVDEADDDNDYDDSDALEVPVSDPDEWSEEPEYYEDTEEGDVSEPVSMASVDALGSAEGDTEEYAAEIEPEFEEAVDEFEETDVEQPSERAAFVTNQSQFEETQSFEESDAELAYISDETSEGDLPEYLTGMSSLDPSGIDEDFLKELVAETVRQELTGDLGERITRNVRKLVRREIQRALSMKDFE